MPEAKSVLLFSLVPQLWSQFPQARWPKRFPKGKLLNHWFCRRNVLHPHQLRVPRTRLDWGQGSLAASRLNRQLRATMSPSDAAIGPHRRLWFPARGCPGLQASTPNRASQGPSGSLGARCRLPPRGAGRVLRIEPFPTDAGMSFSGRLAACSVRNEAKPSWLTATAGALAFPSFNGQHRSHLLKGRLHDSGPLTMVNPSQFTRSTKLCLALSEVHPTTQNSLRRTAAPDSLTKQRGCSSGVCW